MVDICRYELPTNLQNFMQKDLTEVKIFQKVLGLIFSEIRANFFLKHPTETRNGEL